MTLRGPNLSHLPAPLRIPRFVTSLQPKSISHLHERSSFWTLGAIPYPLRHTGRSLGVSWAIFQEWPLKCENVVYRFMECHAVHGINGGVAKTL